MKTITNLFRSAIFSHLLLVILLFIGTENAVGQTTTDVIRLKTDKNIGEEFNIDIETANNSAFTIEGLNGNDEDGYTVKSQTIVVKGNIESMTCYKNSIVQIDLSDCHQLKKLDCRGNKLTTLDVSSVY